MHASRQRGFAMLIVLWSLLLLSLIGTRLLSGGRMDTMLAGDAMAAARLEAASDAAIHDAAFRLIARDAANAAVPDSATRTTHDGVTLAVEVTAPRDRVNPNTATPPLLTALIAGVTGLDTAAATRLAEAIFDWRTPGRLGFAGGDKTEPYSKAGFAYAPAGRPFADMGELRDVIGVTPTLLSALRPYLSLYAFAPIDPSRAQPAVRRALIEAGVGQPPDDDVGTIATIVATAALPSGAHFVRAAVIQLKPGANGPFRILAWERRTEH